MHQATRRIAALVFVLPIMAASDTSFIDRIQGYYSAPGRLCTEFEGGKYLPCNPPIRDCLQIKKVDDTHAEVVVDSVQRNGAECGVEGIAKVNGNTLEYVDRDSRDPISFGSKLLIHVTNGAITFESISAKQALYQDPFCGTQGKMRWVKFLLKHKRPVDSGTCGPQTTSNR